jgi:SNF family Na+-dependent transporter
MGDGKMPVPQIFNFLFFLMLLTLGIDSSFGTVEGTVASILDFNSHWKRWQVSSKFRFSPVLVGKRSDVYIFSFQVS